MQLLLHLELQIISLLLKLNFKLKIVLVSIIFNKKTSCQKPQFELLKSKM